MPSDDRARHVASIDLEDWYHDVEGVYADSAEGRAAFERQVGAILEVLDDSNTRCTFFALGRSAARHPTWIRRIHELGHELASHGYQHELVRELSREHFAEDLERSCDTVADLVGERPIGYRAPYFSVSPHQTWLYDALAAAGMRYSSSVQPFAGRRFGDRSHGLAPVDVSCEGGASVREFPLAVVELFGRRVPVAGGGYWRLLPERAIHLAIRRIEKSGRPFVGYLHPHEFDSQPLRSHRGSLRNAYVNLGRHSVRRKLARVLARHRFGPFRDFIDP